MEVSELRQRILRALDEARKESALRRSEHDAAKVAYDRFLSQVAIPLFHQAATVLRAEGKPFTSQTPLGTVRLAADRPAETFVEIELDLSGPAPRVIGRTSLPLGGARTVVQEHVIAPGRAIADVTEEAVAQFLAVEIPKLVTRT